MGKPGKLQKPVEKAEKKSRATGRQKPYTRSSAKIKKYFTSPSTTRTFRVTTTNFSRLNDNGTFFRDGSFKTTGSF